MAWNKQSGHDFVGRSSKETILAAPPEDEKAGRKKVVSHELVNEIPYRGLK